MDRPVAKRILILVTLSELGGAQKYVRYLATGLKAGGFEVAVGSSPGPLLAELKAAGIETVEFPEMTRGLSLFADAGTFLRLLRLLRGRHFDLVHTNSSKAGAIGGLAARLTGARSVFTAHGFFLMRRFWGPLKRALYVAVEFVAVRLFTDRVVCVSEADLAKMLSLRVVAPGRARVIRNGLDASELPGTVELATRAALLRLAGAGTGPAAETRPRIVATVANFYPIKALADLVDAAELVAQEFPEAQFVVIGDGQERGDLERRVAERGLGANFRMPGRRADASQLLAACDVFAISSVAEGLPYALLEAMAQAKPLAVTAAGGIPEVVEDGRSALVVKPGDAAGLARSIVVLLSDVDRAAELGCAARRRLEERFLLAPALQAHFELYEELGITP